MRVDLGFAFPAIAKESLIVSTFERKPFSFKTETGWAGFCIDVLEQVGARMDWTFSYVEPLGARGWYGFSRPILDASLNVLTPLGGSATLVLLGAGALISRFETKPDGEVEDDYDDGKIGRVGKGIWLGSTWSHGPGSRSRHPRRAAGGFCTLCGS